MAPGFESGSSAARESTGRRSPPRNKSPVTSNRNPSPGDNPVRHAIAVAVLLGGTFVVARQPPPAAGDQPPGRKWSEEQLKQFSGAVRAGRKLTPKVWPNGARVAVALTITVNKECDTIARGD